MNLRRLTPAVFAGLATLAIGSSALAAPSPDPQVQVLLPVVNGGITVVVSPGVPGEPVATAPQQPVVTVPDQPQPQQPVVTETPEPQPEGTVAPPPQQPEPPGGAAPAPTDPAAPTAWPDLPTAQPTYVTTTPAPTGESGQAPPAPGSAPGDAPTTTSAAHGDFLFGVFGHSTDRTLRFQEKVGRPVEVIGVFPARGSWDTIMDPWWLDVAPEGFTGILDVGVPLWQEDGSLSAAAGGADAARWEELGRVIHERYPGSTVRIGWEFNLGGWSHHATDENVEEWKQAFRHASAALKRGGPSLLVTWNPNKGRGDSLADASKAWPGDDVVDIVAIDAYDWWPAYSESTWPEHRDGDQGWRYWVDFARSHGKQFAVPEWGVAPGNDHGGGDNPYYIGVVMDFLIEEHRKDGIMHSAVYFDEPDAYIANSIGDGQVPRAGEALAEKLRLLGSGGGVSGGARPGAPPAQPGTGTAADPAQPGGEPTDPEPPPTEEQSQTSGEHGGGQSWSASDGHGPVPPG
ncbi:MAG: hypothetical protein Q4G43_04870 [Mobilicoccus sp.]|nr:hypothetical protein [Mobilicoccus sp.]